MNLPNKILKLLLAVIFVFGCLLGSASLQAQSKKKKKTEIEIPAEVLQPDISEDLIRARIDKFSEWAFASYPAKIDKDFAMLHKELTEQQKEALKQQKKNKKKKKGEDETIVTTVEDARKVYLNDTEFGSKIIGLRRMVDSSTAMDDVEEVTGIRRSWFQNLAKAAEAIGPSVKNLTKARRAGDEETFSEYFKEFKEAVRLYKRALNSSKPHIDEKTRDSIAAKNVLRRKKAYLEKLKKEAAEKKAQQTKQPEKKAEETK